jgi:hypothetical protein
MKFKITAFMIVMVVLAVTNVSFAEEGKKGDNVEESQSAKSEARVILEEGLEQKIVLLGVNQGQTSEGYLKAQVQVYHLFHETEQFFYKFEWLDEEGNIIDTSPDWLPLVLEPKETFMVMGIAPSEAVKDFHLLVNVRPEH